MEGLLRLKWRDKNLSDLIKICSNTEQNRLCAFFFTLHFVKYDKETAVFFNFFFKWWSLVKPLVAGIVLRRISCNRFWKLAVIHTNKCISIISYDSWRARFQSDTSHTQSCKNVQYKYVSFNTSVANLNPGKLRLQPLSQSSVCQLYLWPLKIFTCWAENIHVCGKKNKLVSAASQENGPLSMLIGPDFSLVIILTWQVLNSVVDWLIVLIQLEASLQNKLNTLNEVWWPLQKTANGSEGFSKSFFVLVKTPKLLPVTYGDLLSWPNLRRIGLDTQASHLRGPYPT